MNLNGIVNMVLRNVINRAVNFGVNKGVDVLSRRSQNADPAPESAKNDDIARTPEERAALNAARQAAKEQEAARAAQARKNAENIKQTMRNLRRFTR